jgi:nitric oxide reductase subunit C
MDVRTAKWIFWAGTLSSLIIFLVLTYDTERQFAALTHADKLDARVIAGKKTFEARNCNDCHTILGFGAYYAPDLTRSYYRIGEEGILRRLQNPEIAFASSYRKMPQQHLSQTEMQDLVAYLKWVSNIDNHDWPPQDSRTRTRTSTLRLMANASMSPGAALIQQEGCLTCHSLGQKGESIGPRLEWIGAKHNAVWIANYIQDPQKIAAGVSMPAFDHLSQTQREAIGEFITSLPLIREN